MDNINNEQLNSNGNRRGMNQNSRNNLHPNRNGRLPSKLSLTSLTKVELARVPTMEEDGFDGKEHNNAWWLVRRQVREAREGDKVSRSEVWDRAEGKVATPVDLGNRDGQPIRHIVEVVDQETKEALTEYMKK